MKLIAVGDICLGDHYFSMGHGTRHMVERIGLRKMIGDFGTIFKEADFVFCNLEGPISDVGIDQNKYSSIAFRGSESFAGQLAECGFNVINLANNHILQHGLAAAEVTRQVLEANNIHVIGLADKSGKYRSRPALLQTASGLYGFLGYSLIPEQYKADQEFYAQASNHEIVADVKKVAEKCDCVIVSLHWGHEATTHVAEEMISLAESLSAAGARILLGHHSHVIQPLWRDDTGVVFFGLGDFIFDLFWAKALRQGLVPEIHINESGKIEVVPHFSEFTSSGQIIKLAQEQVVLPPREVANVADVNKAARKLHLLQIRKLLYFLRQFHVGATVRKWHFLKSKIIANDGR